MNRRRKAQAAFEYMAIFIIVLSFVIPVWFYVFSVRSNTTEELYFSYAKNAVDKITQTADLVFSQGPPAKLKVRVYIPDNVMDAFVDSKTAVIKLAMDDHETYVTSLSTADLNGTLPSSQGLYWMNIEAMNEHVQISVI